MTTQENKDLKIPDYYRILDMEIPVTDFPVKEKIILGSGNDEYDCILMKCIVEEEVAMDHEDPQKIINDFHESMEDDTGIIEVDAGKTKAGRPYVYFIIKHALFAEDKEFSGTEYTMNINVKYDDRIYFINSSFVEGRITGKRDTAVFSLRMKEENIQLDEDPFRGWSYDPYDPEYTKGFLMNRSEDVRYDAMFPDHPLSKARQLVRYIIDNN
ncbi:MAG: hypothetical protein IJI92_05900 [Erysipelotrichaceae bacterium]|nr:hypothetical protein [Erysipelotrichaceae bacterium]